MRMKEWTSTAVILAISGIATVTAGAAPAGNSVSSITPVPEPNGYTLALMALTLGCGLAVMRRKPK